MNGGRIMRKTFRLFIAILFVLCFSCLTVACNDTNNTDVSFTLRFDANGGIGSMQDLIFKKNEEKTLPVNSFERANYSFAGWATSENGDAEYSDGDKISLNSNTTLFAIWTRNNISATVTVVQRENEQSIRVGWSNPSEALSKIEVSAYHGNDLVDAKTITNAADIQAGHSDLNVYWGKYDVKVKIYGENDNVNAQYNHKVNISTDSYRIAYMYGTFPVSIFTLQMMDKDNADIDSVNETFVHLSGRYKAYDWEKLPPNMKPLPVALPGTDGTVPHNDTAKWIKELYEMNNEAHFTFYFNDVYIEMICSFFIDNDIPVDNWDAIMYSDGVATAGYIKEAFDCQNPQVKYAEMATAWNAYVDGNIDNRNELPYGGGWNLPNYAYVVCNEMSNVKWYTGRLRTTENVILQNTEFANAVVNGSKEKGRKEFYLNNLLAALSLEEKATFKSLYHIDESTFAAATEANKKVMMILGTDWDTEKGSIEDYLRITMEVYGDEYVYYYKGHPGFPTSSYTERAEILNNLTKEGYNLYELDNSVAAEFFLFFFDDIEMIGYPSTTFESGLDTNADGVFGQNMDSGYYSDLLETYISKITDIDGFNTEYSDKNITLDTQKEYYLIEFQKEMAIDKSIAIYDVIEKSIVLYKLIDGNYQIVTINQ